MLRVRDFGHFCPEGEVGRVRSASFSDFKRFSLKILLISAGFIAQPGQEERAWHATRSTTGIEIPILREQRV